MQALCIYDIYMECYSVIITFTERCAFMQARMTFVKTTGQQLGLSGDENDVHDDVDHDKYSVSDNDDKDTDDNDNVYNEDEESVDNMKDNNYDDDNDNDGELMIMLMTRMMFVRTGQF